MSGNGLHGIAGTILHLDYWVVKNMHNLIYSNYTPIMSGPGFLSTSPESRISSISAFITDYREVVATKHSNEKMSLRRTGTREEEEERARLHDLPAL